MKLPSREDKTKQTKTNEMRMCECKRITHHFNTFENDHTKTCHRFQFIDFTFVHIGLETKRHETKRIEYHAHSPYELVVQMIVCNSLFNFIEFLLLKIGRVTHHMASIDLFHLS